MKNYNDKLRGLEFSLTMGCVLNCDYCPQSLLLTEYYREDKKRKKYLEFNDFKVALNQVDAGSTISICGMSEPFSNPRCADMILYAYEQGYSICFNTTLVGATIEDLERIKDVEFENFILHIPDKDNHSKFTIDNLYLELLDYVHKTQEIDYYSCHGSVHSGVEEHIDTNKYAGIVLGDRAGNIDLECVEHCRREGHLICRHGSEKSAGIWSPVMLPDGTLVLCCNDYGMKHVLGNILEKTWAEIKEGDSFKLYQEGLKNEKVDILCRTCESAKHVSELPAVKLSELRDQSINSTSDIKKKFDSADVVCVYGLGKYFRDHYFDEYWQEAIRADFFCDRDSRLWGREINGIRCCSPKELSEMNNTFVIVFSLKSEEIIQSLIELGITNVISIERLMEKD